MTKKFIIAGMAGLLLSTAAWAEPAPLSKDDYIAGLLGDDTTTPDGATQVNDAGSDAEALPTRVRTSKTRGFGSLTSSPAPASPAPAAITPVRKPVASSTVGRAKPANVAKPAPTHKKMADAPTTGRMFDIQMSFDLNSSNLTPESRAQAVALAEALKDPQMSGKTFLIGGHTDSSGSAAYNRVLSKRRAEAVADYLVEQGVDRTMLRTYGFGYDQPLEGMSAADAANRRVEAGMIR